MTQRYNAKNERIKKEYFRYLVEADGKSPATLDSIRKSLRRFEETTGYKDFSAFHYEQIIAFKKKLMQQKAERSGEPLSKGTLHSTLKHLKAFFGWLAGRVGYKSRIQLSDIGYFRLSENDTRAAREHEISRRADPGTNQAHHHRHAGCRRHCHAEPSADCLHHPHRLP